MYRPSPEVIAGANVQDWDERAARAEKDLAGF
jgi:hypothetical protein